MHDAAGTPFVLAQATLWREGGSFLAIGVESRARASQPGLSHSRLVAVTVRRDGLVRSVVPIRDWTTGAIQPRTVLEPQGRLHVFWIDSGDAVDRSALRHAELTRGAVRGGADVVFQGTRLSWGAPARGDALWASGRLWVALTQGSVLQADIVVLSSSSRGWARAVLSAPGPVAQAQFAPRDPALPSLVLVSSGDTTVRDRNSLFQSEALNSGTRWGPFKRVRFGGRFGVTHVAAMPFGVAGAFALAHDDERAETADSIVLLLPGGSASSGTGHSLSVANAGGVLDLALLTRTRRGPTVLFIDGASTRIRVLVSLGDSLGLCDGPAEARSAAFQVSYTARNGAIVAWNAPAHSGRPDLATHFAVQNP